MKLRLNLGDTSNDGHGKTDTILFESSHTVEEIRKAYKASCQLTGVSFSQNEDFTGVKRDWREADNYRIATEYEKSVIPKEAYEELKKFGIEGFFAQYSPPGDFDKEGGLYIYTDTYVALWIWFVTLSLPELKIGIIRDEVPVINAGDLDVQFGYGLFL